MAEFLHPSVSSRIIDNSTVFVTAQGQTALYAAFPAAKGPDNRVQLITSESEFLFYYGAPDFRKYGQTALNVIQWLRNGGVAYCLRILPYAEVTTSGGEVVQTSTHSCYIVEVGCRYSSAMDVPAFGDREVKVRVRTLGDGRGALDAAVERNIRDDDSLKALVLSQPDYAIEEGGIHYRYHPLMVIRGRDRGQEYNKYGVRLEVDSSNDNTYDHRLYQLTLFSSPSNAVEGPFFVALYPEALDRSGGRQHIVDILNRYSNVARAIFSEEGYDAICEYVNPDFSVHKKLDILSLKEREVAIPEAIHQGAVLSSDSADLSPTPEVFHKMGGGSDGVWEDANSREALLYKAYSGGGDFIDVSTGKNIYDTYFSMVLDKKAYPIDLVLDANYPASVKTAMSNFAVNRGDLMAILDVGFTGSPTQALKYRQDTLPVNTFHTAIFVQDFIVFDEYSGGDVRVTPTYFLASKIPQVDIANGIHVPFVGPRRGTVSGFKEMSWAPNPAYREELYKAKLNYVERDVRLTRFNSQSTSQLVNSALSDISHVRTLLRIRRDVENLVADYLFEFNDATTWGQMEYSVNGYLQRWIANRALTTAKGTVYASEYDRQQRIVRVKIELVFTGLIERVMVDLVVNR